MKRPSPQFFDSYYCSTYNKVHPSSARVTDGLVPGSDRQVSVIFDDLSVDEILKNANLNPFKKVFELPVNALDLPLILQNLLHACELVEKDFGASEELSQTIETMSEALVFLESLSFKIIPKSSFEKPHACLLLLNYSRVVEAEKSDLAFVLVAMYFGDKPPRHFLTLLNTKLKKDLLPEVSIKNSHKLSHSLARARLKAQKYLYRFIESGGQTPYSRLQAHYTRLHDVHDLQKRRVLTTHFHYSKEEQVNYCHKLCESAMRGDLQAICELLSLHINCPPSHVLGLPLWPMPGSFHWLNLSSLTIQTSRALFVPNGSLKNPEDSKNWYLERPLAMALIEPLKKYHVGASSAQFLGDLFDAKEFTPNRQNPWLTDLRNRLPIEAAQRSKDDVLAAMAFSDPRLLSKGSAYYQTIKQSQVVSLFSETMESFGIQMSQNSVDSDAEFGSMVEVSETQVSQAWAMLATKVQSLRPSKKPIWAEVVAFHNAFAMSVAFGCTLAFAFRAAVAYPISRSTLGPDFLAFCDKNSHDVKEIVEVPLNSVVKGQIQNYLAHLDVVLKHAKRLRIPQSLIDSISAILNPDSEFSLLFVIHPRKLVPIGSTLLLDALKQEGFEFAPNFGRHLMQRTMHGLSRVEQNQISRHGSVFQSSNNCGASDLSPSLLVQDAVARSDALFNRLNIVAIRGLNAEVIN